MDLLGNQTQLAVLTQMVTTWGQCKLHLFTNNHTVQDTDVIGAYTEVPSNFSWYTSGGTNITYGTAFIDAAGLPDVTAPAVAFYYGASTASAVTCYGAYITNSGASLVSSYNFVTPLPMQEQNNAVIAGSQLQMPPVPQTPWVQ
jgi:hypothetical protein